MGVDLEHNSLVKSIRYLIVISFQGGVTLYGLDTLQLTQEEEKCSLAHCSTQSRQSHGVVGGCQSLTHTQLQRIEK